VTNDYKDRVLCRFDDSTLAEKCYADCEQYKIFEFLETPWKYNEHFIVLEGVQPDVYTGRAQLMKSGLGWRGGHVIRFHGTRHDAEDVLAWHEDEVRILERWVTESK
ncbi:hypothetical protein K435DRAFT_693807, partial [Dendrothele bispora CBS 962.96]